MSQLQNITHNQKIADKLIDVMLKKPNSLFNHLFSSYHQLIEEAIPHCLNEESYFYDNVDGHMIYHHGFKCKNVRFRHATFENENKILFPKEARKNHLDYFGTIVADVVQVVKKFNSLTGEEVVSEVSDTEKNIPIAKVPIMVKSKYCSTQIKKDLHGECKYDPGGYFIVKGMEKVVMCIEKMVDNKIIVHDKSDKTKKYHVLRLNSKKNDFVDNLQISTLRNDKDDVLILKTSQLGDVPLIIILKAMGLENDKDIISNITYDLSDEDMINLLRPSISKCFDEEGNPIRTKEEAIEYLITLLKQNRMFSQSDKDLAYQQKKMFLSKILSQDLFPHCGNDIAKKVKFLCLMANTICNTLLGRREVDDRDNFQHKRVETPGILIGQLFRQGWKKMLNDVMKYFRKIPQTDDKPINVIGQLNEKIIEQTIKTSLSTGLWGSNKNKKGVAQSFQRLSWIQTLSNLRRVMSQNLDAATTGETSIRSIHNLTFGFLCPVESPEGQKIGIVKSLSFASSITDQQISQREVLDMSLEKFNAYLHPADVDPLQMNDYIKIFFNGDWVGCSKDGYKFYKMLIDMKNNNNLEQTISICMDFNNKELRVYYDAGRLYRPLLQVEDNELNFTKDFIKDLDKLKSIDDSKAFVKLTQKYKNVISYEDMESSNYIMVCPEIKHLDENNRKTKGAFKDELNRYGDNLYVKYTHCELHPWLSLGAVTSLVPFVNHNYGTKNINSFSKVKQSIGTYLTSYKDRIDKSQILYHPQLPIVGTRGNIYNRLNDIPIGENIIVAIMSYNGYNQEDSLIFNQSAVDRGLFRADTLDKYSAKIEKNPSTSKDDIFTKPDPNQVADMKHGNYSKLNEDGYIPEETEITRGDILIGKISPIQPTGNNKVYKDNSEIYKSNVPGVVDRVHTGVYNSDGYEMYNMRVRMERVPMIADKFSNRFAQKGTIGILLPQKDMPFTEEGIIPDMIMNPLSIPSRMTISQLIEMMAAKVGIYNGEFIDGTPFCDFNTKDLPKIMEKLGLSKYGTETLYCGMTGRKMKAQIFMGPVYTFRLKHMVLDKIHGRSTGPIQALTRQPLEGRAKDGGLKIGTMECDALIAHGAGQFLKERMMECSDITKVYVCDECGLFASKVINKDYHICHSCNNTSRISPIVIPYATKLLFQELMSVNILPRIKTDTDIYGDEA